MAKPITFTGIKLRRLDIARRDPNLTDAEFRLFHAIVSAIDRDTEQAIRKRENLAREAALTLRTVQKGIVSLEKKHGLILVQHGRGRGQANIYELAPEKRNETALFCAPDTPEKGNETTRFLTPEKGNLATQKGEFGDRKKGNETTLSPFSESHISSLLRSETASVSPSRHEGLSAKEGLSDGRNSGGFWGEPYSAEWTAWLAYYEDNNMTRAKRGLVCDAHAGKSTRFPSPWPPGHPNSRQSATAR